MTLLIALLAAILVTLVWYHNLPKDNMKLSTLCYLYWGASLMWMVDAVFAYLEAGPIYFEALSESAMNDSMLGISAVVLGLLIWLVQLFISDPEGKMKAMLLKKE